MLLKWRSLVAREGRLFGLVGRELGGRGGLAMRSRSCMWPGFHIHKQPGESYRGAKEAFDLLYSSSDDIDTLKSFERLHCRFLVVVIFDRGP